MKSRLSDTYLLGLRAVLFWSMTAGFLIAQESPLQRPQADDSRKAGADSHDTQAFITPWGGRVPWFNDRNVQTQLGLTAEQAERLRHQYDQSWEQYQREVQEFPKDLRAEERMKRSQIFSSQFRDNFSRSLAEIISDRQQFRRFRQLQLQYQGLNAFDNPDVQEQLNLNREQRRRLTRLQQSWNDQIANWQRRYGENSDEVIDQFQELRRKSSDRIGELLNEEQRAKWKEMIGDPYNFSPDVYIYSERNDRENALDKEQRELD